MTADNRFSKPVAFNRSKEIDKMILKHVARRNFSGYVKKLILADIEAKGKGKLKPTPKAQETPPITVVHPEPSIEPDIQPTSSERLEQMKKQIKKTDTNAGPKVFINRQ